MPDTLRAPDPFTDLSFELLAEEGGDDSLFTLQHVASVSHMMKLGRPLFASLCEAEPSLQPEIIRFAATKLLKTASISSKTTFNDDQMLACLSRRIPINFMSANPGPPDMRSSFLEPEQRQVESHLRIYLKVERDNPMIATVASSEPLLSEASFALMQRGGFSAPSALLNVLLSGCPIAKDDGGELLVILLAVLARDAAVRKMNASIEWPSLLEHEYTDWNRVISVPAFLRELFRSDDLEDIFSEFKDAKLHFNHFIEVHEADVLQSMHLTALLTRGTAVFCGDKDESIIYMVIPIMLNSESESSVVESGRLALICIRVAYDKHYQDGPNWDLCKSMGKWFEENEGLGPVPVIRIVFALASETPMLRYVSEESKTPEGNQYKVHNIWCAGLSPDILPQVKEEKDVWDALLRIYRPQNGETDETIQSQMSMHPGFGGATSAGFWKKFYKIDGAGHGSYKGVEAK